MSAVLAVYTVVVVRDFPLAKELGDEMVGGQKDGSPVLTGWTLSQAIRSRAFYAITLAVALGTFTYAAILPQIIPHLTDLGFSLRVASVVLSVFAVFGMIGKYVMGYAAERLTSRVALMINFVGQAVFLVSMIWAGSPWVMWISTPLFGFFNGAFGALFQLVVQDTFGVRNYGGIMGLINMTTMISFGVGPILAGASFDITGSYEFVFFTVAAMFITGALALTQATTGTSPEPAAKPA